MREAVSITICNYSSLNMAINMGFAARNQIASDKNMEEKFQARTGQVTILKDLIGGDLLNAAP